MRKEEIRISKQDLDKSIKDLLKEKEIIEVPTSIMMNIEFLQPSDVVPNYYEKTKEEFVNYALDLAKDEEVLDKFFGKIITYKRIWTDFVTKENLEALYDKYIEIKLINDLDDYYIKE